MSDSQGFPLIHEIISHHKLSVRTVVESSREWDISMLFSIKLIILKFGFSKNRLAAWHGRNCLKLKKQLFLQYYSSDKGLKGYRWETVHAFLLMEVYLDTSFSGCKISTERQSYSEINSIPSWDSLIYHHMSLVHLYEASLQKSRPLTLLVRVQGRV